MLVEIDSSEFISCIVKHEFKGNEAEYAMSIKKLYNVANTIEREHPSIVVDINKFSIEAFRCRCSDAIKVSKESITIKVSNPIVQEIINRYQPSENNRQIIITAFKE